jgi:hypothetical protein
MKPKYTIWITLFVFAILTCVVFGFTEKDGFELAKQELLLRKIGHQLLLTSGDSTSRVLPVKKINENEYQIRFENELTFQTDSLVKIINHALTNDQFSGNYIVNVINCSSKEVIYGYSISKLKKDDIVACSGRKQPKGCYLVDIKFQPSGITASQKGYLISGLSFLAFVVLLNSRYELRRKKSRSVIGNEYLTIGNTLFDPQKRNLIFGETVTELTSKENKLLLIFAKSLNVIIERNRLQKEIWEDEGVIVGRSLDMFISKLRKKLENDLSLNLKNIHGKGYILEA